MNKILLLLLSVALFTCKSKTDDDPIEPTPTLPVQVWTTSANHVNLLYSKTIDFAAAKDSRFEVVQIDTSKKYQSIEGFGYSLTGGSAQLLFQMGASERSALLQELFGKNANSIGVSYLRISIGASDLDPTPFSYDDLPTGQSDPDLLHFNLSRDTLYLIPILKEILAINPGVKLMGSPWSAPKWMKNNNSTVGGNLKPAMYASYAQYFVKYLKAMAANGITLDAVTVQNEPQHGGNNPSMVMAATEQRDFIKNNLGPALQSAGLATKIVIWDHNCDNPGYPLEILADPAAKAFVYGSAFHLYGGDISALSQVHDAYPDRALFFTEQWTGGTTPFEEAFMWHMKNVMIGSMRNWSGVALQWNLANDPNYEPHTPGGCTLCQGAVTIDGSKVTRNSAYYVIAQMAKFVPQGSVRLESNTLTLLPNVAFRTPDGKTVLIVLNEDKNIKSFNINAGGRWIVASLHAETAGTFIW